ncbi:MAG: glutamine--fructose-6-phosphate transaminase (isomerizing) [Deltaproteobacteria bacterium]|nr:glutamine--fructose-6-phosphate transaminase (isomerizing) [Deltaproteobacteria bacterium]
MCGIIGYLGPEQAAPILVDGLRRLEYRGYDSAGLALVEGGGIQLRRAVGKLRNLDKLLLEQPVQGTVGIGHTRWATHGRPTEMNAHPHCVGTVAVVHNGIIENHLELKAELRERGHVFASETDTEVYAHLIDEQLQKGLDLPEAVRQSAMQVRGSYAIAVVDSSRPDRLVVAKQQSPLIIGLGDGENFAASDIPAVIAHTRNVIYLEDGDFAQIQRDNVQIWRLADGATVERAATHIGWSAVAAEKGGFKHFMLKEIHEQSRAITDTVRGRASVEQGDVFFEELRLTAEDLAAINRIVVVACGTSWHAGLVGKHYLETATRLPVEVDLASEFRYRDPVIDGQTLVVAISQSGETADTLAAIVEAKARGAKTAAICNVIGSSIARAAGDVVYTHAGPEIGVASTKAFTTQMVALYLLAVYLGRRRGKLSEAAARNLLTTLAQVPSAVEQAITLNWHVRDVARRYMDAQSALYLGRGMQHPIALEGALKLKEISYIHAEGYAAGEMKHGPIALVDEHTPTVIVAPRGPNYEKTLSNLQEILARRGHVIAVGQADDDELRAVVHDYLALPPVDVWAAPIVAVVPLQLFAYHIADLKGTDVDQPRNLAKSVTVE